MGRNRSKYWAVQDPDQQVGTLQLVVGLLQQDSQSQEDSLGVPFRRHGPRDPREVTAGVRVTLAYQLRRKDGASASTLIPRTLDDATEQTAASSSWLSVKW
jgi:hypothetical protein